MDNLRQTFFLYHWWLMDIYSSQYFSHINTFGVATSYVANATTLGIRSGILGGCQLYIRQLVSLMSPTTAVRAISAPIPLMAYKDVKYEVAFGATSQTIIYMGGSFPDCAG